MQRERLPYILIPVAAFITILPLLMHGCSCGHDFNFHLLNWLEAARQFTHGNLHPHWAYTPAYNAGEPRFVFYPPLSWTIGAILGLIFPWTWCPILYTWLALTAAGLSLFRLARNFAPTTAAALAAVLYTVNPYMLFTAYERTAYAELLAAAFIPFLLLAILRDRVTIPRIAIPIALLWLTNAPAAVMSCYALALLAALRLLTRNSEANTNPGGPFFSVPSQRVGYSPTPVTNSPTQARLQLFINVTVGTILGLGLAAIYILPAAHQRRYVQIAMATDIPIYRFQNNFLFRQTGDAAHDRVLHTASVIAIILIAATAVAFAYQLIANKGWPSKNSGAPAENSSGPSFAFFAKGGLSRAGATAPAHLHLRLLYSLAILTIAITLLLTPLTTFLWNHAPELAFLQFPWRLTAILAAVLCLVVALALSPLNLKPTSAAAIALILAAALTYPAYKIFHQPCDPEDTVQATLALFNSNQGADPTDEYTPTNADNDSLARNNPPYWLSPDPNSPAPANTEPGPAPIHVTINSPTAQTLILNLRDYPVWRITLNGVPVSPHLERSDGLIAFPVPAGPSTIDITSLQTTDQTLGDLISLASLALLILNLVINQRKHSHNPHLWSSQSSAPSP
jgi:hypothetical protein